MLITICLSKEVELPNDETLTFQGDLVVSPSYGRICNNSVYVPRYEFQGYDYLSTTESEYNITVYTKCPKLNKYQLSPTSFNHIYQPVLSMNRDSILVEASYYREAIVYSIGFCEGFTVRNSTESAPTATFPGALSGRYGAYTPSTVWDIKAINCSQVLYTMHYNMSSILREMSECLSVSHDSSRNAKYSSNIYIYAIKDGIALYTWRYPIELVFNLFSVSSIGSFRGNDGVTFRVSVSIELDGRLSVKVISLYERPDRYLEWHDYECATTNCISLRLVDIPKSTNQQEWRLMSTKVDIRYEQHYVFKWRNSVREPVHLNVSIIMYSVPRVSVLYSMNTTAQIFSDKECTTPLGTISRDTVYVCIRNMDLSVPVQRLDVVNIWICRSKNQYSSPPDYDPQNGLYGCTRPSSDIDQIYSPYKDMRKMQVKEWEITEQLYYPEEQMISVGIRIRGVPKAIYGFQIESVLTMKSIKRTVNSYNSSNIVVAFVDVSDTYESLSAWVYVGVVIGVTGLCALVVFLVSTLLLILKLVRSYTREMSTDLVVVEN